MLIRKISAAQATRKAPRPVEGLADRYLFLLFRMRSAIQRLLPTRRCALSRLRARAGGIQILVAALYVAGSSISVTPSAQSPAMERRAAAQIRRHRGRAVQFRDPSDDRDAALGMYPRAEACKFFRYI